MPTFLLDLWAFLTEEQRKSVVRPDTQSPFLIHVRQLLEANKILSQNSEGEWILDWREESERSSEDETDVNVAQMADDEENQDDEDVELHLLAAPSPSSASHSSVHSSPSQHDLSKATRDEEPMVSFAPCNGDVF